MFCALPGSLLVIVIELLLAWLAENEPPPPRPVLATIETVPLPISLVKAIVPVAAGIVIVPLAAAADFKVVEPLVVPLIATPVLPIVAPPLNVTGDEVVAPRPVTDARVSVSE